jgi:V8-like Glu-specific endopeptidase
VRNGRIIVEDPDSAGAITPPDGTFPWLASLFLRKKAGGGAYFLCSATILTPSILVSAVHCFNNTYKDSDWFVRVGDNFLTKKDPNEQTFQVKKIYRHKDFLSVSSPGGDGRHDIAILVLKTKKIKFDKYVAPICLPNQGFDLDKVRHNHCEIAGWGRQEYNNKNSYPDSIRAARITVGIHIHFQAHTIFCYIFMFPIWSTVI